MSLSDPFHSRGAERADQLVLQVFDAEIETELFHVDAREVGTESGSLETAPEVALLARVAEASQPDVEPCRAELIQKPSDRLSTSDRNDGHAFGPEIAAATLGERLERTFVADPFDKHDRPRAPDIHLCIFYSARDAHGLTSSPLKRHA